MGRPLLKPGAYQRPDVPDRHRYQIGALGKILGEPAHTLRFWEVEFDIHPLRAPGGQRYYSRSQVDRLVEVQRLIRSVGLTHDGVRSHLKAMRDLGVTPEELGPDPEQTRFLRKLRASLHEILDLVDEWERRSPGKMR